MRDQEAIPAATLILMRPKSGRPDLLAIERATSMAFAGGAIVFPGGRIDADDRHLAERIGAGVDHAAARIAAIRETIEETGIAPSFSSPPDDAQSRGLRAGLRRGEPFSTLLDRYGLHLDLAALTMFARWMPNFKEARRFDTLFFLAEAPEREGKPVPDGDEAVRSYWADAPALLGAADRGEARLIFPTRRTLERLALYASIEEARLDAGRYPLRTITAWVERRGDEEWVCIPDDLGYPVTAERLDTVLRS